MVGYKHPCRYCNEFNEANANVCAFCGKINPVGQLRCPRCRNPIRKNFRNCSHCGLELNLDCPACGEKTFFGDYCEKCQARLTVTCPHPRCGEVQAPLEKKCVKCGKPL